jgi:hypothetical protein
MSLNGEDPVDATVFARLKKTRTLDTCMYKYVNIQIQRRFPIMAKHTLFEDAAAVLSGSKANAPADPPKKLDAEIQDLGGPTPQNSRPEDDSNKLNIKDLL